MPSRIFEVSTASHGGVATERIRERGAFEVRRLADAAAFAAGAQVKAPGDWRTPTRFVPGAAHLVFTASGAARST
jgi:hypothetical protein